MTEGEAKDIETSMRWNSINENVRQTQPYAEPQSAVIHSLLITARRYRLDPAVWLTDVLRRIPTCNQAHLPELLP